MKEKLIKTGLTFGFFPANIYLFKASISIFIEIPVNDIILVYLLLTLNRFHTLFWCFYCWLWANNMPAKYLTH